MVSGYIKAGGSIISISAVLQLLQFSPPFPTSLPAPFAWQAIGPNSQASSDKFPYTFITSVTQEQGQRGECLEGLLMGCHSIVSEREREMERGRAGLLPSFFPFSRL